MLQVVNSSQIGEKTSAEGSRGLCLKSLEDLSLVRDLVCSAAGKRR